MNYFKGDIDSLVQYEITNSDEEKGAYNNNKRDAMNNNDTLS